MLIRLQKYLADCGLASRRKAESLILAGQIKVNGQVINKLGSKIDPDKDRVSFGEKLIRPEKFVYLKLNKPKGYVCTSRFFKGEKNIFELINIPEKIFPVGRLDKNTEGLILLTNDGDFSYRLTHPKFQIEKEYEIILNKPVNTTDLDKMKIGLIDQGEKLKIEKYKILTPKHLTVILTQGHKREIRRLFERCNYQILNLKRIRFADWDLGSLAPGQWEYFRPQK